MKMNDHKIKVIPIAANLPSELVCGQTRIPITSPTQQGIVDASMEMARKVGAGIYDGEIAYLAADDYASFMLSNIEGKSV